MANRFPLWGQAGWASAEVVGETHYAKAIRALFGNDFNPQGTDITVPVQLIPDRSNRHDRNSVGVWSGGSLLGHLPRPEAARYVQVLTSLTTRGMLPEVNARIHGREWGEYDGRPAAFDSTIRLDLAEPHMLVPANSPPPQEHRVLPTGSAVQVNGQQLFLDALRPLLRPEGECWAYVTLHEMADHLVEVRVGDARVGDLSPKMSGELLPALRHLAEQGLVTAARAIVKGNDGKAEVMLYVARAHDLPESWQGAAARQAAAAAISPAGPRASTLAAAVTGTAPGASGGALAGSGRASASFPASGAATTGPAATGTEVSPGPAGWAAPGEPAPSWAAPAEPVPSWAAGNESGPSWAAGNESAPSWAAGNESAPSWAAGNESAPAWSAAGESAPAWSAPGDPGSVPSWATPSEPLPAWAESSSSTLPTLPSAGALPGGAAARLDPPDTSTGSIPRVEANGAVGNSWLDRAGAVGGSTARLDPLGAPSGPPATEPVASIAVPQPSPALAAAPFSGPPATSAFPGSPAAFAGSPGSAFPGAQDAALHGSPAAFAGSPGSAFRGTQDAAFAASTFRGAQDEASAGSPDSGFAGSQGSAFAGSPVGLPLSEQSPADLSAHPVSPAPLDGAGATIAETTVIPALAAVVKGNAGRRGGVAPVSPAADGNPHPAIPEAPTGIRFAVPPGWPVPPAGWYPPAGWRPDPSWPLAPSGWQWWVPTWD